MLILSLSLINLIQLVSLLPNKSLALKTTHLLSDCAAKVLSDNLVIILIVSWVQLPSFVVFELWVLFGETIGQDLAS